MAYIVLLSGLVPRLQPELWSSGRGRTGHPISVFALLVGGVLACLHGRLPRVKSIHEELCGLDDDLAGLLGLLPSQRGGRMLELYDVDHLWNRLVRLFGSSRFTAGKRRPPNGGEPPSSLRGEPCRDHPRFPRPKTCTACFAYRNPDSSQARARRAQRRAPSRRGLPTGLRTAERAERSRRLNETVDSLLGAPWPRDLDLPAIAVDWTDLDSAANPAKDDLASAAPDAAWGRRPSKHNRFSIASPNSQVSERQALARSKKGKKGEMYVGYSVFIAATTSKVDGESPPAIAKKMRLVPANAVGDSAEIVVDITRSAKAEHPELKECILDMGFSLRKPEKWWRPLMRMGVYPVFDMPVTTKPFNGESYRDAPLWNGIPACPVLAKTVPAPKVPDVNDSDEDWDIFHAQFEYFERILFRRLGANPGGPQRYQCPGITHVACPGCAQTYDQLKGRDGIPHVKVAPTGLRCCNTSMVLPLSVGEGRRMKDPWNTPAWARSYARRGSVERINSAIKHYQQLQRGAMLVLDRTAVHLMTGFVVTAANIRQVRAWQRDQNLAEPDYEALATALGLESVLKDFPPTRSYQ